ncbi:alpha/beta hydrolase [Endozoicomonas sp. G2_1]|uniref:alpha/beta fold hydrolase n=1 Tax=Endozoicomonas sp. G2_1 TaxID=2821091 RepID=UPI001ADD0A0E|nr:alpha/beta hydrolase [Endozoicomonas sp. G2_1]MBO9488825.1 alpha/beta hydrolase [Endozoicomonas sp. G2_1]
MTEQLLSNALTRYTSNDIDASDQLFEPQFADIKGFKVRYVFSEKKSAPNLVLLNGFPQSIRMWQSAWPALTEHFNLLAFDIPGFGLSSASPSDMSPSKLSAIVIDVLDHFGFDKAHLVGPDVGVPITLATAINHPERLHSINIFDGPGHFPPAMSPILKAVINFRLVRWLAAGINKKAIMKTNFMAAIRDGYHHYRPTKTATKEYYQITHDQQAHQNSIAFFGSYQQELRWIGNHLSNLKVPALVTWGQHDPFVYASNADYLAEHIPHSKKKIFDNASHFSAEDAGDDYTKALIQWCLTEFEQVKVDNN